MQVHSKDIIREKHWDNLFKIVDYTQVLWHQNSPQKSVDFINLYVKNCASIVDVGCGTSLLVDSLIQKGYKNLTLIDTSITALEIFKSRIKNNEVKFICCDIFTL